MKKSSCLIPLVVLIIGGIFFINSIFKHFSIITKLPNLPGMPNISDLRTTHDSQEELGEYLLIIEKDGKKYDLGFSSQDIAFDRNEKENHLYGNMVWMELAEFIALAYDDVEYDSTDNPFVDGEINYNSSKYEKSEQEYETATKRYTVEKYFDNKEQQIYQYIENKKGQEFIQKLYPKYEGTRSHPSGGAFKDEFIDITAFLQSKLNKKVRYTIDDDKKMITIRFEDLK
jgi:hypothetical protein